MRKLVFGVLFFSLIDCSYAQIKKTELTIDSKVNALIRQMTLEEKVGQMTEISIDVLIKQDAKGNPLEPHQMDMEKLATCIKKYKVGSILNVGGLAQTKEVWQQRIKTIQEMALQERLKIPVIYGVDAIHGNNYTMSDVMFPQQIAQAASFNPAMSKKVAEIAAYETRASFIPWTFSPVQDLGRQQVWPRIWETFGEDPYLCGVMGSAVVEGFQGNNTIIDKYHVAACLKHYMGYSMPLSGHDRTPAWIPERELREYFLPPFAAAIKAGAKTVMINSGEINGLPVHANKHIITDILKTELQFKGFAVSDWQDIEYLYSRHKIAKDNKEAVMMAVNAGIDMSMVPYEFSFCDALIALVKEGKVPVSRIDDAVRRILRVKFEVGLFENPIGNNADYPDVNSDAHNKTNYDAASECITLLKNSNSLLPLGYGKKILVTGPASNSMRSLDGGWSRTWQGDNSNETESGKNTIYEAIKNVFGERNVAHSEAVSFDSVLNISDAVSKAANADVILLCLGENSYTETPGNINDLDLSEPQLQLTKALAATGKPIVMVFAEGRPRVVSAIEPFASAVIQAYLPGNEGGNVIADAIIGKVNPSGKLPYTYPRYSNALINYYYKNTETLENDNNGGYNPQWEFGYGLSFTTFKYSNLQLSSKNLTDRNSIRISADISNTGKVKGKESVLFFVSDLIASITPEAKRLRGFEKIELNPGETKKVSITIRKEDLSFINNDLKRVTEHGEFKVTVGDLSAPLYY